MGAQLVKEVATTNDTVGDGTTATLLAQVIVNEGLRKLVLVQPIAIRRY